MKKILMVSLLFGVFLFSGCTHNLRISNTEDYFVPPSPPRANPVKLGVSSSNCTDPVNSRYITAIVDSLQKSGNFERVIYPFSQAANQGQVDTLVDIIVKPKYDGDGANFFVNFPGFLIFAPAIWGYGYSAEIETQVNISNLKDNTSKQQTIPTIYSFRHADMGRTWTEVGWLEVGIIPFIGGIVFTRYDTDVTDEFITKVSPRYGDYVSRKIISAL